MVTLGGTVLSLDEPFFREVGKPENQNFGIQNPERVQDFLFYGQPSAAMEGKERKGTSVLFYTWDS